MNRSRILFWLLVCTAISRSDLYAAEVEILIVHSYHESYEWVQDINKAMIPLFASAGVTHRVYYMDTKRRAAETMKQAAARKARKILSEYSPQVLIAVDDNAQAYLATDYASKNKIQIVFCGVNADPRKYGYPAANVTGILERTYPIQTLHVLKTLIPAISKVAVVCDNSATADLVLPRIRDVEEKLIPDMGIVGYYQPATFPDWKQVIARLDQDPQVDALLIPLYQTVHEKGELTSVDASEVIQWTLAGTQKPVVGLWPSNITDGELLVVAVNPAEHGRVAAQMALEILNGRTAGEIPMRVNQEGYVMVNLKNKHHLALDPRIDIDQVADMVLR